MDPRATKPCQMALGSRQDLTSCSALVFLTARIPTLRAGTPATMAADSTSDRTTEPAPTTAPVADRNPRPDKSTRGNPAFWFYVIGDAISGDEMSQWSCVPAQS